MGIILPVKRVSNGIRESPERTVLFLCGLQVLFLDASRKPRLSSYGNPYEEYWRIAGVWWQRRQNIIYREVSSGASGLRTSKHQSAQTFYSTSGADMLRRMCPNATQNCSRTANFGSSGQRKSARDSPYQSPQLAYVAYVFHSGKLVKFFRIWWTRRDSNPRPPRCERGKDKAKMRCHNHLAF